MSNIHRRQYTTSEYSIPSSPYLLTLSHLPVLSCHTPKALLFQVTALSYKVLRHIATDLGLRLTYNQNLSHLLPEAPISAVYVSMTMNKCWFLQQLKSRSEQYFFGY